MQFNILTLFPHFFETPLNQGVLGRAHKNQLVQSQIINIRDFTEDAHQSVDDRPFGGGDGMLLSYKPLDKALKSIQNKGLVIYLSPQGERWNYKLARQMSTEHTSISLICGRYSGVDARWIHQHVDKEVSIGDYVVSGGEVGALILMDSISRYIPNVLGHPNSADEESFEKDSLLEHPQWTRPQNIKGYKIPEVFLSGNHEDIQKKRYYLSLLKTKEVRPDLLNVEKYKEDLSKAETWFKNLKEEEKKACNIKSKFTDIS